MAQLQIPGVEINAVMHCNLACAGCSHASPLAAPWLAEPTAVCRDLTALSRIASIGEVRVVGGEPLLHPELTELLQAVRSSCPGSLIRVITNGTRLDHSDLAWLGYTDEVYVSVYPRARVSGQAAERLRSRAEAHGIQVAVNRFTHFRPVVPRRPLTDEETAAVFETCQVAHSWSCHTVQEGYVYLCPMTVPMPGSVSLHASACAIEPIDSLPVRLRDFLGRTTPLPECRSCLGTVGQLTPHRQASRKTWLSLSVAEIDWGKVQEIRADPWADNGCVDNTVPLALPKGPPRGARQPRRP
jgi:GTP 3',8-cyclase